MILIYLKMKKIDILFCSEDIKIKFFSRYCPKVFKDIILIAVLVFTTLPQRKNAVRIAICRKWNAFQAKSI